MKHVKTMYLILPSVCAISTVMFSNFVLTQPMPDLPSKRMHQQFPWRPLIAKGGEYWTNYSIASLLDVWVNFSANMKSNESTA